MSRSSPCRGRGRYGNGGESVAGGSLVEAPVGRRFAFLMK